MAVVALATVVLACSSGEVPLAQGGGMPLQENLPKSWYRNYDYGVEVNGDLNPDVGLFQVAGEKLMLVYGPALDSGYVLSFVPKVVRPVSKAQVTSKSDLEVLLPPAAVESGQPIPWMQDGPTAVIFYAGPNRYKILRVPPIVGTTTVEEIFKHNPIYKRGREEYVPKASAVSALKAVQERTTIEVWFGSWCPHCQRVVPRFMKTIQAAGNPSLDVVYEGVPREFGNYDPAVKKQVAALPTFIFLRNGKEFARMGGPTGVEVVEDEMARILGVATTAGSR